MATKKTGLSRDLIIHPGETIADVLEERNITQAELAARIGKTPAYVSSVISGKKGISANFAMALEYAFGVPKTFWLNLQARYEAELLEFEEYASISEEERDVMEQLKEVIGHLRSKNLIPRNESKDKSIVSLRRYFNVSSLVNLEKISGVSAFRMGSTKTINPYVLGAWVRMCQISGENSEVSNTFNPAAINDLIVKLKKIMTSNSNSLQQDLKELLLLHGIDFSIVKHFRGAPVQGFINKKKDGTYQICMTIRRAFADIFWFSLFHELGHIVNGDLARTSDFVDDGSDALKEQAADRFASDQLINPEDYERFVNAGRYHFISEIRCFAEQQGVMPYTVIGRLQKEKRLGYGQFAGYKTRYKWVE